MKKIFLLFSIILMIIEKICCEPKYYLFTQKNMQKSEKIINLTNSIFYIPSAKVKFLVHGFGSSGLRTDLLLVKDEILKRENVNCIVIDWRKQALKPDYFAAAYNTKSIGTDLAKFIYSNKIDPKLIHCIGHSLGAHVCGFAGKSYLIGTRLKLNKITGLDPAGPLFNGDDDTIRLDKNDALMVDVIHTDSFYGLSQAIGHQDFYPNGGKNQPHCEQVPNGLVGLPSPCSHAISQTMYAKTINSHCDYTAVQCSDYNKFKKNECNCSECTKLTGVIGYHSGNSEISGKFYLDFNLNCEQS